MSSTVLVLLPYACRVCTETALFLTACPLTFLLNYTTPSMFHTIPLFPMQDLYNWINPPHPVQFTLKMVAVKWTKIFKL